MEGPMEQKISSSNEKRILVSSISHIDVDGLADGISPDPTYPLPRTYSYAQFSLVDLNLGELVPDYVPSLLQFGLPTSVLPLDNSLYLFGGKGANCVDPCHHDLLYNPPKSHQQIFVAASRLCLDSDGDGWCPVPQPIDNPHHPRCFILFNKAYIFGSGLDKPEVFDPMVGCWKPITVPADLVGSKLFYDPLPDPSNNRILLHLINGKLPSPAIYSFTPTDDGGKWKIVTRSRDYWFEIALVVDDVVYFTSKFRGVVRAFDIQSGEWLNVHWASKFEKGVNMNRETMYFEALFQLGDKILCLAAWTRTYEPDESGNSVPSCSISFFKFRVKRSGSTVNLFPLSKQSFVLPATRYVLNFVPF